MCTFTLAWRVLEDAPVAVAANRDEAADRPSEPPEPFASDPTVIAPRDTEAGGTWIGVNEYGLVAGITNRWAADLAGERSRGLLVADVLACSSAPAAIELVERAVERHEYDGFYLTIADADDAVCLGWNGEIERIDLSPGVTVVVNVGLEGAFDLPPVRAAAGERQRDAARTLERALAVSAGERADAWLDRARPLLADHEYGVCVHRDGFGTRSSSLIATGPPSEYRFAPGPPCETPYEPVETEGHI